MSEFIIFSPDRRMDILSERIGELTGACDCAFNFVDGDTEPHNCRVRDVVCAIAKGDLVAYANNRGNGGINVDVMKRVSENLQQYSLAQFVVGPYKGKMSVADGNSRIEGLMQKFANGKLTEDEMNYVVSVRYVPENEFLKTYETCNSAKPHTASEKISNPDFLYGKILGVLDVQSGGLWGKLQTAKRKVQMTYLIEWFFKKEQGETVRYVDIFWCRDQAKNNQLAIPSRSNYKASAIPYQSLIEGLKFYKAVVDFFEAEIKAGRVQDRKSLRKLATSGPLFAIIVADVANKEFEFGKTPSLLARRMMGEMNPLLNLIPVVTCSTRERMLKTEMEIRGYLRPTRH